MIQMLAEIVVGRSVERQSLDKICVVAKKSVHSAEKMINKKSAHIPFRVQPMNSFGIPEVSIGEKVEKFRSETNTCNRPCCCYIFIILVVSNPPPVY